MRKNRINAYSALPSARRPLPFFFRLFLLTVLASIFITCSKLDTEKNCLNQKVSCFKPDVTAPRFSSSQPDINPSYTVLDYVDLTFSEEVKNGEDVNAYTLPTTGGASNGLKIQSVQKIAQYTYRVFLGGASIATGAIRIDFSKIVDFNGNFLTGINYVDYTGSANIPITLSVKYLGTTVSGVSNNGGGAYSNVDISFSHKFTADNANTYNIYLTTGATTCSGTPLGSGTNLAANVSITPINRVANLFPQPVNRIVVCVANQNNPTAVGTASWLIYRDDTIPTVTANPPPDNFSLPKNISLTCVDANPDRIVYTSLLQQNSAPGLPTAPGFDAVGVINPTSNLYTGPITATNPANPTYTRFRWQCIDIAGNRSDIATPTDYQYYVDSTIPAVTLMNDTTFRAYIGPANTSTTIKFSTDQLNKTYYIKRNGTTCTGGGDGIQIATGSTGTPGSTIQNTFSIPTDFPGANAVYPVRICVAGPTAIWGTEFLYITTDSTAPIISPTVSAGTYSAVQSVTFNCTDTNLDKAAYRISTQLGNISPTPPTAPTFNAATGAITSATTLTGPYNTPDSSTTIVSSGCIDLAGNQVTGSNVQYIIDGTVPAVTFVSSDHTGATINGGGYTSVNITWNTSQAGANYLSGSNFEIRASADCVSGTILASGLSSATPNANNVTMIPASTFPAGANNIKICVKNYAGAIGYQTAPLTITRDDALPTFAGITTLVNPGDGTITLSWAAGSDALSGLGGYDICQSTIPSPGAGSCTASFVSAYQAAPGATSFTITGLNPATTYYFMVRARDNAGNRDTNVIERKSRLNLNMVTTGYTGPGPLQIQVNGAETLSISGNGTQTFSTVFSGGNTYRLAVITQPTGQICAIKELQFGTFTADTTLNVACATGALVGGRFQALATAPLTYRLYQGKTTTIASGFSNPENLAYLGGYLYLADASNHVIKKILATSPYTVTTLTSTGTASNNATDDNLSCASARFSTISAIHSDGTNLYVAEWGNGRIRKVSDVASAGCSVTTLAGTGTGGFADGTPSLAQFDTPYQIVTDGAYLYVADNGNHRIRRVKLDTGFVDTIAGSAATGSADNANGLLATFDGLISLALSGTDLYVGEYNNPAIRKISLSTSGFPVTTVAGAAGAFAQIDAKGLNARLGRAISMTAVGSNIYFVDFLYNTLRRMDIQNGYNVTTIAGNGAASSVDGTGASATFNNPHGITTDGRNLYVVEYTGNRIRKVVDNGLVAYWPLNGLTDDYSSDGSFAKNGTINGNVSSTPGRYSDIGGAYSFDGVSDYVAAPAGTQADTNFNGGNFTIAFWMKPAATQVESDGPARDYDIVTNLASQYDFAIRYHNEIASGATIPANTPAQIIFIRYDGSPSPPYCISGIRIDDAKFHHVTAQKSGTILNLFIDGKKVCSTTDTTAPITSVGPVRIGARSTGTTNDFTGTLADMRMYNRALNEGEINELAQDALSTNGGTGFSTGATGLLAHYEFSGAAYLQPSGPVGGPLGNSASTPVGKDGDVNGSAYFSGGSNLPGSPAGLPVGNAPRTMCAFIAPQTYPSGTFGYAVSYGDIATFSGFGLGLKDAGGGTYQIANTFSSGADNLVNFNAPLNSWNHLCATYDGTTSKLYWNGTLMGSQAATLTTVLTGFKIGSWVNNTQNIQGKLDDIRIYNNALSALQIRQLATQVPGSLLARFDFGGDSTDSSGWLNNLTSSGTAPILTTDRFLNSGNAYNFSGNGRLQTATALTTKPDDVSITAWFRPTAYNSGIHYVIINGSGGDGYGVFIDGNAGNIIKGILGGLGYLNTTYVPPLNVWTHITMQRASGTWAIFVNGVSLPLTPAAITLTTAPIVSSSPTNIGGDSGTFDYLTGDIDDARVYNKALNPGEVRALAGYHPMQAAGGLILHMNAESLSNLTSGTQISQWNDTSASAITMSQATPGFQPLYSSTAINGRPGVDFNSRYFDFTCNGGLNSSANTIMGVFNQPSASGSFQTVLEHGNKLVYFNGTNNQFRLYHVGSGPSDFNVVTSPNSYLTLGGAGPNMIFAIEHDGTSGNVYKNGTSQTLSSAGLGGYTYSCGSTATMGQVPWGPNYFNGHIGDLIYFNQALTATSAYGANTDREVVDCYLSAKYGIALGHTCP